jgi:hypothetical protein
MKKSIYIVLAIPFLTIIASVFISCNNREPESHPMLKASLTETEVSVFDIFDNVEIIPIETSSESLFRHPVKMEIYNDTIFIMDDTLYSLLLFTLDGKYLGKIQKVGRGPGEYLMAYDFAIDNKDGTIMLLNPMGSIHTYDLDGNFIKMENLPKPPYNYRNLEILDDDNYITWSSVFMDDEYSLNIIGSKDCNTKKAFFPNSSVWAPSTNGSVFSRYKGDLYYNENMSNIVYHVTQNGPEIAYEWDTGIQIVDPKELLNPKGSLNDIQMKMLQNVQKGKIPFYFGDQLQSDRYYYAMLIYQLQTYKYLFYDKATEKSVFFHKTTEGIELNIIYMTDNYAIGFIRNNDTEGLQSVVSPDDMELLRNRKEDDNWWLVKYTFKN